MRRLLAFPLVVMLFPQIVAKAASNVNSVGIAVEDMALASLKTRAEEGDEKAKSILVARKAADAGLICANFLLGFTYLEGKSVPQDYVEAMKWLRKAAEKGDPSSQERVGWMYSYGKGVPENFVKGLKWYRKAANQGDASAQ